MTNFHAHSANDNGEWHGLVEHLEKVAEIAGGFCEPFGSHDAGYYAGLWHDIGKFNPEFQRYLADELRRGPDHKGAGAKLALQHLEPLALLVQGHHGGLKAIRHCKGWVNEKDSNPATENAIVTARQAIAQLEPQTPIRPPQWVNNEHRAEMWLRVEMWLRMVFSALIDADRLDTEAHFNPERATRRGTSLDMAELWQRFRNRHQENVQTGSPASAVNEVRSDVYAACLAAAEQPTGIFRLAVPTGGGKTLSGMGFALRHAAIHGLDRVIVAVPFISITQQTAGEYRKFFGDEAVLEHHSSADLDDPDEYDSETTWARLASENWDAPIVVTTTVQLFDSLFSNRTSATRKLHNLAKSVIILDEAQALPPTLLEPILDGLRDLSDNYGASVALSTATQPAFQAIKPFADVNAVDIVPEPERHFQSLKRVRYEWRTNPPLSWDDVAAIMRETPQALAIVNTKKDALALLAALNDESALHISTLLCGRHREAVIAEIRRRLDGGEGCRVVSTQVVEAGVDIDFPMVLRAIGPMDSIIQAAGRCNRNGRLDEGRVIVFRPETVTLPRGPYRTATDEAVIMLNAGLSDLDDPDVVAEYFQRLYRSVAVTSTIAKEVQESRKALDYPEVAKRFKMIDDDTVSAIVTSQEAFEAAKKPEEWQQVLDAVAALREGSKDARRLLRQTQPWTVSLYRGQANEKQRAGLLDEIMPGLYEWLGTYDERTGIGGVSAMDPDRLVV